MIENLRWDVDFQFVRGIDLSGNHVKSISISSAKNMTMRTHFTLDHNDITSLRIHLDNLQPNDDFNISFSHNSFDCDLSLHNLLYNQEIFHQVNLVFNDEKCNRPDHLKGRLLTNTTRKDLMCNTINYFSKCACLYSEEVRTLDVNCVGLKLAVPPDLNADVITTVDFIRANQIRFNFANNSLQNLPKIPKSFNFNVTEIIGRNNSISVFTTEDFTGDVNVIDLRNNKLQSLMEDVLEKMSTMNVSMLLGGNPWLCDCSTLEFFNSIKSLKNIISDYDDIVCHNLGRKLYDLKSFDVCFNWPLLASCGIGLGIIGIFTGLFYKFKKDIKIFLYAHNMCLWFVSEEEVDHDRVYDAFVCFAEPDQPLVEEIILGLESEPDSYQCLVGIRDWPPGHMFSELVSKILQF